MSEGQPTTRSQKLKILIVVIVVFGLSALIGTCLDSQRNEALKNSTILRGVITVKTLTKNGCDYDVRFDLKGYSLTTEIFAGMDTLEIGDSVLVQVSNEHPRDYAEFIKRVKKVHATDSITLH
ncbi:hypothetical protein BEL04_02635 [Mucilaginibacter sp. PPCGB 2223]|uniref:hypothetical protein n=1 Tax=Mucilaginibacter sp. PPCGB 2223 TaxID=1886027 RepID=UPI000824B4AE|nr:hypothetical protein [Mucilaginibacter sp. PPCGB 2223]OCX53222.1 hypothetical protein BEL04_02635 [Mucilaginibacter sp. PPCGB 2223]